MGTTVYKKRGHCLLEKEYRVAQQQEKEQQRTERCSQAMGVEILFSSCRCCCCFETQTKPKTERNTSALSALRQIGSDVSNLYRSEHRGSQNESKPPATRKPKAKNQTIFPTATIKTTTKPIQRHAAEQRLVLLTKHRN